MNDVPGPVSRLLSPGARISSYEVAYALPPQHNFDCFAARAVAAGGFGEPVLLRCMPRWMVRGAASPAGVIALGPPARPPRHPCFARVYEHGVHGDVFFLITELVQGVSLAQLVEHAPLSLPAFLSLAQQLLSALHLVHEQRDAQGALLGERHGNVSPDTVLVSNRGVVKLADFAALLPELDPVESTGPDRDLRYFAPEQLEPVVVLDRRVDLYGAAVSLGAAATGLHAYAGCELLEILQGLRGGKPPFPASAFRETLLENGELRDALAVGWQRAPDARPASALGLSRKLASVAGLEEQSAGSDALAAAVASVVAKLKAQR